MPKSRKIPALPPRAAAMRCGLAFAAAALIPAAASAKPAPIAGKKPNAAASPSAKLATLLSATRSAAARTGMGLPPYATLLGRNAARRVRAADAALVRKIGAVAARSTRAKAPARIRVQDDDPLKASDSLRGINGRQSRKVRIATAMDSGCPTFTTDGPGYDYFEMTGSARGDLEVTTVERIGRYDVTTYVVIDVRFAVTSLVGGAVSLGTVSSDGAPGTVSLTRRQVARDRKTGRTRPTGPTQRLTDELGPLLLLEGDFDDFIAAQDANEAPAPRRKLRSGVWSDVAQKFVGMIYLEVLKEYAAAEKRIRIPNTCAKVRFDTPERLAPGQTIDLRGILSKNDGKATEAQLLDDARTVPEYVNFQGQSLKLIGDPYESFGPGKPWYQFTAPGTAWPEQRPVGVKFTVWTRAGVAEATVLFKPAETSMHFKIIDASLSAKTSASGDDSYCGTQAGSVVFGGGFSPTPFSPEDKISFERGRWTGEVEGAVNAQWTGHQLQGCRSDSGGKTSCAVTMPPRRPGGDGTWPVSFSVQSASDPSQVELHWRLDQPEVGFVDAGDEECNVHIWGAHDQAVQIRRIPLAQMQAKGPITLTFAGTGHLTENRDGGTPASIDHAWTHSLTIQRVDAQGNPLS